MTPGPTPNIRINIPCKVQKFIKNAIHDKKKRKKKRLSQTNLVQANQFFITEQNAVQNDLIICCNFERARHTDG